MLDKWFLLKTGNFTLSLGALQYSEILFLRKIQIEIQCNS